MMIQAYLLTIFILMAGVAQAETADINSLTETALSKNIKLESLKYGVSASESAESYAGSLNDPMVTLGIVNEGTNYTVGREGMSRYTVMVSQMFPFFGKLDAKQLEAKYKTQALRESIRAEKLEVVNSVMSLYLDLYTVQESKKLLNTKMKLIQMTESSAQAKYSSGMMDSKDVLMVQREKYMVIEALEMMNEKERMLKSSLAHVTGMDSDDFGEFALLPEKEINLDGQNLYQMAVESSVTLKSMKNEVSAMEANLKMKELEKYPDFTVSLGYEPRPGYTMSDVYSASIGFNIPLYYKTRQLPAINEAKAQKLKADATYYNMRHELRSMITELTASSDASKRIMDIYQSGISAKADQTRDAALAAYRQGRGSAADVIAAVNTSVEYRMKYLEKYSERQKSLSRLNVLTGGKLYGTNIGD
ncbi:TolC family protein [Seleniivibrio woodruffii]|uniref:TolC family protein n=1 Tax=Seleniivibrio woodruffii TaxID=1078050 RepID=UPI0026EA93D9|nr:TolC family protein [Seleniivibrio woodruffii]